MDKRQLRATPGLSIRGFITASAGLAVIAGLYLWLPWQGSPGLGRALLFTLHALSVLVLESILRVLPLRRDWRYRAAFLLPLGVASGYSAWRLLSAPHRFDGWGLFAAGSGAFLGALLATALNESLWEDNSPPSERIQAEVHACHRAVIGAPGREPFQKRIFDVGLAAGGVVVSAPAWLLAAFLIWIEDPGPLLFVKNSVGKGGVNFRQYKLRTMVRAAETGTGPVSSYEEDERVLWVGRVLRKTALDELPQLLNILRGEMSFVGPRPQRTVLVRGYLERMPEYAERHRVLPGLAGLAQVAGDYYLTPRQKLRFDRLYIRHRSLGFDLKLMCMAFAITFWYRWQKGWNGRLPRNWFKNRGWVGGARRSTGQG